MLTQAQADKAALHLLSQYKDHIFTINPNLEPMPRCRGCGRCKTVPTAQHYYWNVYGPSGRLLTPRHPHPLCQCGKA